MNHIVSRRNNTSTVYILFISYFIFLLTTLLGITQHSVRENLNFLQDKYNEINDKYNYLINNMSVGNIEENNREVIYLDEMRNEILDSVGKEGEFWKAELKNIILQKEKLLSENFMNKKDELHNKSYLHLKNEIDEYNLYYSLGKKPLDYLDGFFIRYFLFLFNSLGHQIFLTCIVLGVCYLYISDVKYIGFSKTMFVSCIPILCIQIFSLICCIALDDKTDIYYPVRIVQDFNIYNFNNNVSAVNDIIPLHIAIFRVLLLEVLYIAFIVSFIKIIDLIFTKYYMKIIGAFIFLFSMFGMLYTRYSSISFLSYGKFLNIVRGYEAIYNENMYLSINFLFIFVFFILIVLSFIYFLKKYFLNDEYIV
ncbi:hypothetical protein [Candidatus Arthromitus sp. SFB-rat-Yit]|uniref:hypothetical protein n=1 Tax=Candidatus Arthromitus sp. SFB-rat-Yit TaxID=1041504 RepID=UPI000227A74F|nr:hypothetical protein [Candidatus Arthromitus sp. SFB-rat-Yit]BAK80675.1 putative ABC transporter, permease protein [Candidatus Arthromitus sp. SFB-rat-Yit]